MSLDLKELADELDELRERLESGEDSDKFDESEQNRFDALVKLEKELGGDLHIAANHGHTVISEDDFEEYCKDSAVGCGIIAVNHALYNYVNWTDWAEDCRSEYSVFEFEGETFYHQD